jgi:hypothetical protein
MSQLESKLRSSRVVTTGYAAQPEKVVTEVSAFGNRNMSHVTQPAAVFDTIIGSGATLSRPRQVSHYVTRPKAQQLREGSGGISATDSPRRRGGAR